MAAVAMCRVGRNNQPRTWRRVPVPVRAGFTAQSTCREPEGRHRGLGLDGPLSPVEYGATYAGTRVYAGKWRGSGLVSENLYFPFAELHNRTNQSVPRETTQ